MSDLSAAETKRVLLKRFPTIAAAAHALQFDRNSLYYWLAFGAPPHIARALTQFSSNEISLQRCRYLCRHGRTRRLQVRRLMLPAGENPPTEGPQISVR